jgi:hypothetical protein
MKIVLSEIFLDRIFPSSAPRLIVMRHNRDLDEGGDISYGIRNIL